ncbi:hypothetical protein CEXT_63241 [Caerostris extrusa]|uniref:Uncharacterized protein n=1 Tax=Caerostris extrusa TaxID=172846 RepID=A0AAV4RC21_CAEEX|nr:hypothetical protein CEXT_63241 [Caerostris extrusa]
MPVVTKKKKENQLRNIRLLLNEMVSYNLNQELNTKTTHRFEENARRKDIHAIMQFEMKELEDEVSHLAVKKAPRIQSTNTEHI